MLREHLRLLYEVTEERDIHIAKELGKAENSIRQKYPRLREKYPDYEISIKSRNKTHNKEYLESLELMINLNNNLKQNKDCIGLKKVKI